MSLIAHLYGKCNHAVGLVTLTRLLPPQHYLDRSQGRGHHEISGIGKGHNQRIVVWKRYGIWFFSDTLSIILSSLSVPGIFLHFMSPTKASFSRAL